MAEPSSTQPAGGKTPFVGVSTGTLIKGALASVVGMGLFFWGKSGGHGPIAMGPGFVQVLGLIIALYGVATLTASTWTRRRLKLSKAERAQWLPKLAPRKEELLERMAKGEPVRSIADELQRDEGVPDHVTLRYIIEIGQEATGSATPGRTT